MFVYDADMEWDIGMPWYRPTRVVPRHQRQRIRLALAAPASGRPITSIACPPMIDIGPGSPVGVEFGYGAKFPAKYQKALFICDWTFGTMYALHIEPNGSTYKATKEEFLSRTPLPLTDVVHQPGRRRDVLHHRRPRDAERTVPRDLRRQGIDREGGVHDDARRTARPLRQKMEELPQAEPTTRRRRSSSSSRTSATRTGSSATRLGSALEHQPVKLWQKASLAEPNSADASITGAVAWPGRATSRCSRNCSRRLDRARLRGTLTESGNSTCSAPTRSSSSAWVSPTRDTAPRAGAKFDPHVSRPRPTN